MNSALSSLGFGFVMAVTTAIFLAWAGFIGFRSRWVVAGVLLYVTFFCACVMMWAQDLHFAFHIDRDAAKITAWAAAGLILFRVIQTIVDRAPPTALLACLALLLSCGLCGALVLWAPYHNLVLLVVIVGLVALVSMIVVLAWVIDRVGQRNVQYPRQPVTGAALQSVDHAPALPAPPNRLEQHRGNLPAVRR
jgi:hypothetical protein